MEVVDDNILVSSWIIYKWRYEGLISYILFVNDLSSESFFMLKDSKAVQDAWQK